jgi:hypothetical protein
MPRADTGMNRVASDLGSTSGQEEYIRGAHLLQKAGGGEGSDNGISHSWADPVKLPDLLPPHSSEP